MFIINVMCLSHVTCSENYYGRPLSVSGRPCYILSVFKKNIFMAAINSLNKYLSKSKYLSKYLSLALVNGSSRKFYTWWTLNVIREVTTWIFSWSSLTTGWAKKWRNSAYFQTPPANFLLLRPNAAEYCNSEKKLLSTDCFSTRNATFREHWHTNPWDPRATLLFLKSNRLRHVLFPFAKWQHCWYCCTVGFDMCIRRTRLFLSRVSILTRDIDIANLSVRPSVRPSNRNVPVSDKNGLTYGHNFFTVR